MLKLLFTIVGVGCLLTAACVQRVLESAPAPIVPSAVPEKYRAMYGEIAAEIDRQLPLVGLPWGQKKTETAFGVELLVADSNRGETLLNARVLEEAELTLERLKKLGVRSVSLSLNYPMLTRNYPRTAEYRDFYRRLAEEIRKRGLQVVVEMGSAFREPELSQISVDYRGLKREKFSSGLREMAEAIVGDIRPEFLTILSEPDTQTRNTGLAFSPAEFAATVGRVAKGLDRPGVRLGAGAGTWSSGDYFKSLAAIAELDYIDLHIHPVQYGCASDRVLKAAEAARAKGKGVSIGEAWLYKVSSREFDRISPAEAFGRNVFSFWQPLDENFIQRIANLAREIDAEFCSFDGMPYLYSYLDYTPETGRLTFEQLQKRNNSMAWENLQKGALSATGEKLKQVIER